MPNFVHGKNSHIKIDNAANALQDVSNVVNSVEMPRSIDTGETSTFGTSAKTYVAGQNDSTVSISGLFDPTFDQQVNAVIDAIADGTIPSTTVEYGPMGSGTGKPKFTLEVIWTTYSVSAGVGDVNTFSLEGQRTGGTVRSTY